MRTIIAGTRTINDIHLVEAAIDASGFEVTEVVSGAARGVDTAGELWARSRGVPVTRFRAKWSDFGRMAGPIRNLEMVRFAAAAGGCLIAIWDGVSRGTAYVISCARKHMIPVYVHRVAPRNW